MIANELWLLKMFLFKNVFLVKPKICSCFLCAKQLNQKGTNQLSVPRAPLYQTGHSIILKLSNTDWLPPTSGWPSASTKPTCWIVCQTLTKVQLMKADWDWQATSASIAAQQHFTFFAHWLIFWNVFKVNTISIWLDNTARRTLRKINTVFEARNQLLWPSSQVLQEY